MRGALRWDRYVDDGLIDVAVDGGTVTLSGAVGSAAERTRAITDAWVKGVDDVKAGKLTVEPWASRDAVRRNQYVDKSDDAIKKAIEQAMFQDPRVLASNVEVSVDEGVATLRGSVDYLAARSAATQVARDTVGVHWVRDRLAVRPVKAWSDAELARRVESAWLRDPYVEMFELEASVNNGKLRIEGTTDTTFERARAEQIAYDVPGVTEVSNNISVITDTTLSYSPYVDDPYPYDFAWYAPSSVSFKSDRRIEQEIEDELWWSPFVDSDRVNVSVDGGVATLTGTADDWGEHQAATENALQAGAIKVVNEISINYGS